MATLQNGAVQTWRVLPGLLCVALVVVAAYITQAVVTYGIFGLGSVAFIGGMVLASIIRLPANIGPGLEVATKPLLRFAVVLLGLQMNVEGLVAIGWPVLLAQLLLVVTTLTLVHVMTRVIGLDAGLGLLIAIGSAICGASAILAANQVLQQGERRVAFAVACITIFGTVSVLVLPIAGQFLGLTNEAYAVWAGAAIHEVAQVVAAASYGGMDVSALAIAVKLSRVLMLPAAILTLAWIAESSAYSSRRRARMPGFVFGYAACVVVSSTGLIPPDILDIVKAVTALLLAVSLAAIGLQSNLRNVIDGGWQPLVLAFIAWVIVTIGGFAVATLHLSS
ncbi:MAG: YeiH family protein [Ferrovibrio sp.]|uniref:YeiH family protein n=1 Tax=Ferrovibrio sp. TaxID=1917215 RepID=UPI003919D33F